MSDSGGFRREAKGHVLLVIVSRTDKVTYFRKKKKTNHVFVTS